MLLFISVSLAWKQNFSLSGASDEVRIRGRCASVNLSLSFYLVKAIAAPCNMQIKFPVTRSKVGGRRQSFLHLHHQQTSFFLKLGWVFQRFYLCLHLQQSPRDASTASHFRRRWWATLECFLSQNRESEVLSISQKVQGMAPIHLEKQICSI